MNSASPISQKPRLPWSIVNTIEDEQYAIEISRLDLRLPKYSLKILTKSKTKTGEPQNIPFIPLIFDFGQFGKINFRGKHPSESLYSLLQQAEEWVITTAAVAIQTAMIEKEEKQAEFGKQVTRQTGKTERNRNKGKE
jgi:hypothetical protein